MTLARNTLWTLTAVAGFALPSAKATAQDPPLPQKNNAAVQEVNARKESRGIPPADLPTVKAQFLAFAKYYGDVVAHPTVYKAAQDPKIGVGGPKIPTIDRHLETGIIRDLDRFLLEPLPTSKVNAENADYIRELGIALDATLKPMIEGHPETIVRINAARVLAEVCRSGATAHWPTITGLLTNANTRTEIKYYALQAAGNLLSAYDVNEYKTRKHSNGPKEVGELVLALQECILNPNAILSDLPGGKVADAAPDQLAVIGFVRRQAVRALSHYRFVVALDPNKKTIYPAYTLALVCFSDAALIPTPTPLECAEAVIGLCNMAPVTNGNPVKSYNADGAVEAVTVALMKFAAPRVADPGDKSLPWRATALRLNDALKNWRPLFDPGFEATRPNAYDATAVPPSLNNLLGTAQVAIFTPMEKVDPKGAPDPTARVDAQGLQPILKQLRENPARKPLLFTDNPNSVLPK